MAGGVQKVPIAKIRANPQQPRTDFAERELSELAESVKAVGILQPLIVRPEGDGYQLIAGERRLRAAKLAGLETVPVIERTASDDELLTLALVENLQREDLNPIEKAKGFKELIERHNLTQEVAAKRLGKERSTMANFIRLLDLPEAVQQIVSRGTISMGHARALLGIPHPSSAACTCASHRGGRAVRPRDRADRRVLPHRREEAQTQADHRPEGPSHPRPRGPRRQRLGTKVDIEHQDRQRPDYRSPVLRRRLPARPGRAGHIRLIRPAR